MIHGNREQEGAKSDFESEDKFEYRKHTKGNLKDISKLTEHSTL